MKIAVVQHAFDTSPETALAEAKAQGAETVVLPLESGVPAGLDALGRVVALEGDACFDATTFEALAADPPDVLVLRPRSESDLQAEAALEFAIALSESVAGLVLIAETTGAAPGEAGHGGSAVVWLGDVVAEGLADTDVLIAGIALPLVEPEPREPLPKPAPILLQRLANHTGERPAVDYLADLSDGRGPR